MRLNKHIRLSSSSPRSRAVPPRKSNNLSISTVLRKSPFPLPLRTREQAVKANGALADDNTFRKAVQTVADIVAIVKQTDPGKFVFSLTANALVGRFDLAFMIIKVYGRLHNEENAPSGVASFLTDPSKPEEVCLFKLTLNHVRELVRLYAACLEECASRGYVDQDPPPRTIKKDGKDVAVASTKPKKYEN